MARGAGKVEEPQRRQGPPLRRASHSTPAPDAQQRRFRKGHAGSHHVPTARPSRSIPVPFLFLPNTELSSSQEPFHALRKTSAFVLRPRRRERNPRHATSGDRQNHGDNLHTHDQNPHGVQHTPQHPCAPGFRNAAPASSALQNRGFILLFPHKLQLRCFSYRMSLPP